MSYVNWQDPGTREIRSTDISGLQEIVSKLERSVGMETVSETNIPLTEVYISENDRWRIFQAPEGKRNWVSEPAPVIKRDGVPIDIGFVIDYGAGAIILKTNDTEEHTYTADATYIKSLQTSLNEELATHLADDTKHITSTERTIWNNKLDASAYTAADVLAKVKTVDGDGSGLDADLLDGAHAGNGPNNVLKLDSGGFVPLPNIPGTLTGKSADMVDGKHFSDIQNDTQAKVDTHASLKQSHGISSGYYLAKTSRSDQLPAWGDIQGKPSSFTPATHGNEAHNPSFALASDLTAHSNDNVKHITDAERNAWNAKETPAGAQAKADIAEQNAKAYTDVHEQKAAPHSGHETPAGAQAKADAAETNAKNHANSLVGTLSNLLTTAKNNVVAAINEIFGKVEDVEGDLESHKADYAQHGVTMGHENDLYVAKIRPLFEFTPLEVNYGGIIRAIAADDEFVYIGGGTTRTVRKLRKSDLSQVAESASYGGTIYAIAVDDEFVYVGGGTTQTVRKLRKSDLSQVAESASYGGIIRAIVADDEFVYVGGETTQTVRKLRKSDLSQVAESASYGDDIQAIAADDEFVYVGGGTTRTVRKLRKSDLSQVAESASYGGTIYAIVADDEFVYIGGYATQTVRKLRKSDLSQVAESASYGGTIYAIAVDDEFVYIGGYATQTVRKLRKSDLSQVAESASYGGTIYAIVADDEFVYIGGGTTNSVRVIENRDLIKIIRRYQ